MTPELFGVHTIHWNFGLWVLF